MIKQLCFNALTDVNGQRTFEQGRFRKRRVRRKGGVTLRYFEDRMTGHLYAIQEQVVAS